SPGSRACEVREHLICLLQLPVLLADKEGGPTPLEEALDDAVPEYQAPGKKSALEIRQLDPEDESLTQYKRALLGTLPPVVGMGLEPGPRGLCLGGEQAPHPTWGDLAALKSQAFILKEGVDYQVKVTFKVRAAAVGGTGRTSSVASNVAVYMVGSYGPRAQEYEFVTPVEEAPRGALVRGPYVVRSLFTDDDKTAHLSWEWGLRVCQDWKG
uniref:Rho GDP dissociation inhibitor gamma n=1 Tax=Marmota marmota marmota TaxID=9994 RepID=A0A8C6EWF6_MARMA